MKTKVLLFLVFIGFALILPKPALSQGRNPEALKAVQKLKEKMGDKFKVVRRVGCAHLKYFQQGGKRR